MVCLQKQTLYPSPGGYSYSRREGYSDREPITVACGQCQPCRLRRSMEWGIRCEHERSTWARSCFITLTYSDEFIPLIEPTEPNVPYNQTLRQSDFQKFMKRLRKQTNKKLRYYMCGEYGGKTHRPHYHALIFGEDWGTTKVKLDLANLENPLFTDERLSQLWPSGSHSIGNCTYQSSCYTARYIMKKQLGKNAENHYSSISRSTGQILTREPDYNAMSQSLGRNYFYKHGRADLQHGFTVINERRTLVPNVYYKWMDQIDPAFALKARQIRKDQVMSGETWTTGRLMAYEECFDRRMEHLARDNQS